MLNERKSALEAEHAASDTRCHVVTSTIAQLVDYCKNTPEDPLRSRACMQQRMELISRNIEYLQ